MTQQNKIKSKIDLIRIALSALFILLATMSQSKADNNPKIVFDSNEHDFGEIGPFESPTVEFTFSNTGNSDLVVSKLRSSCGCAKGVKGKSKIAPGEKGTITAQVFAEGLSHGPHSKTIYVHTNDPSTPRARLKVKFSVIRHVSLNPGYLAKSLSGEQTSVTFPVKIHNIWEKPIRFKTTNRSEEGAEEPRMNPTEITIDPGKQEQVEIIVPVKQNSKKPVQSGTVSIETDDSLEQTIELRYFIRHPALSRRMPGNYSEMH